VSVTDSTGGPTGPAAALGATMNCNVAATTSCNIAATYSGVALASTATATAWDWGDGTSTPSAATNVAVHTYARTGTFNVIGTTTYTPPGGTLQTARSSQSVTMTPAQLPAYSVVLAASLTSVTVGGPSTLTATSLRDELIDTPHAWCGTLSARRGFTLPFAS